MRLADLRSVSELPRTGRKFICSLCDVTKGTGVTLALVTAACASCWLRPLTPPLCSSPSKHVGSRTEHPFQQEVFFLGGRLQTEG